MPLNPQKRRWIRWVVHPVIVLGAYLGLCFALARFYVFPAVKVSSPTPESARSVTVGDVHAWQVGELAGSKGVFVFIHGYGGHAQEWIPLMERLERRGFPSLSMDLRGHGRSPIAASSFSVREAEDVIRLVRWLRTRFSDERQPRVILVGLSMGGATAWRVARKEPGLIQGVVTEGTFARFEDVSRRFLGQAFNGSDRFFAPVMVFAEQLAGVRASSIVPERDAESWAGRPALVIHTENDELVPKEDAKRIAESAEAPLWLINDMPHAGGLSFPEEYEANLLKVLRKAWSEPVPSSAVFP